MKNLFLYILLSLVFLSCKTTNKTELKFLDEYVLADSILFKNTIIGGLSGVDFVNNKFYFVVDDAKNPRALSANIKILDNDNKERTFIKISYTHIFTKEKLVNGNH